MMNNYDIMTHVIRFMESKQIGIKGMIALNDQHTLWRIQTPGTVSCLFVVNEEAAQKEQILRLTDFGYLAYYQDSFFFEDVLDYTKQLASCNEYVLLSIGEHKIIFSTKLRGIFTFPNGEKEFISGELFEEGAFVSFQDGQSHRFLEWDQTEWARLDGHEFYEHIHRREITLWADVLPYGGTKQLPLLAYNGLS